MKRWMLVVLALLFFVASCSLLNRTVIKQEERIYKVININAFSYMTLTMVDLKSGETRVINSYRLVCHGWSNKDWSKPVRLDTIFYSNGDVTINGLESLLCDPSR